METMGSSCSMHQGQTTTASRTRRSRMNESMQSIDAGDEIVRNSLRHSVVTAFPDRSISNLYPAEDNYVNVGEGTRSPKSLAELATDALCRTLPYLNGELPAGLPQDVVDDIVHSLIKHSALNATTLRVLRNCELPILNLSVCRGVTDEWLEPLSIKSTPRMTLLSHDEDSFESMELDHQAEGSKDFHGTFQSNKHTASSESSCSTGSFLSAASIPGGLLEDHAMEDISNAAHNLPHTMFSLESQMYMGPSDSMIYSVTGSITLLNLSGSQRVTDRGLMQLTDLHCLEIARFDNCHSISGRGLIALASSHRLHTLSLTHCRRLTDEGIINISHLASIKHLSLDGCRCLTDISLAAISELYELQKLDLSQCDLLTDKGVQDLVNLDALEELSLGWCRRISNHGLDVITKQPGRSSRLRVLRLARCAITSEGVAHLARLSALEELDLNGCKIASLELGRALAQLTNLTSLDVSHCPGILKSSWQGKMKSIRNLDLRYSSVKDQHLTQLTNLPALEELNLDSCPIGDSAIGHLADNNVTPNLASLDLADTDLTDRGMAHVAKFTKLTRLSLFYCNISNSGLRHISKLSMLESLNLDSRDISDDGLRYLSTLKNLKHLDVFSGRVTDNGCGHIAKIASLESLAICGGGVGDLGCSLLAVLDLASLNLSQNERITNRGAAALASLTNLRHLNLSNTRVTSAALRFFSELRKLQSLALYGCRGMDNGPSLQELQSGLPNLKCLRLNTTSEDEGTFVLADDASDIHGMFSGVSDEEPDTSSEEDLWSDYE